MAKLGLRDEVPEEPPLLDNCIVSPGGIACIPPYPRVVRGRSVCSWCTGLFYFVSLLLDISLVIFSVVEVGYLFENG